MNSPLHSKSTTPGSSWKTLIPTSWARITSTPITWEYVSNVAKPPNVLFSMSDDINGLCLRHRLLNRLYRTPCGRPQTRRFTSPLRGVSCQLSLTFGKWYGRRTHTSLSWQQGRLRKDGSVLKKITIFTICTLKCQAFLLHFVFPSDWLVFVQNKCVPYWPESRGTKEVGQYVVTIKAERQVSDYKIRILEMFPVKQVTEWRSLPASPDVYLQNFSTYGSLFHSRRIAVPSGTTSTSAGPITESPRSPVASWASSLKWTLNRLSFPMLDPWSSTAGRTLTRSIWNKAPTGPAEAIPKIPIKSGFIIIITVAMHRSFKITNLWDFD